MEIIDKYIKRICNSTLLKGISWIFAANLLGSVLRFFLVFIVIRCYSQEEFGLWASITSIAAIIVTGDFGLTNVLRNIASEGITQGEEGNSRVEKCYFSTVYFFIAFAALITLIILLFYQFIPFESLFKTNDESIKYQGRIICAFVLVIFLFNMPLSMAGALYYSYGENKICAFFNFLSASCTFLIVSVLSLLKFQILYVSITYFICSLVINILSTIYFVRLRKWNNKKLRFKDIYYNMKLMLPLGCKFLVIGMSSSFVSNVITVYSGSLLGLKIAANVNVAQKIYLFFIQIYQSVFNPIWSSLSKSYFNGEYNRCKKIYKCSMQATSLVAIFVIFICTLFSPLLVNIIAGGSYQADTLLFILVGICVFMKIIFDNSSLLLIAINDLNKLTIGYGLFTLFVLLIIPKVVKIYSFNSMLYLLISCWILFTLFAIKRSRTMLYLGNHISFKK